MSDDFMQMQLHANLMSDDDDERRSDSSWFQAMADAWGEALDAQAGRIQELSGDVAQGFESPAQITELTAESLRMGYLSNSSHTALTACGSALETLSRKQ